MVSLHALLRSAEIPFVLRFPFSPSHLVTGLCSPSLFWHMGWVLDVIENDLPFDVI